MSRRRHPPSRPLDVAVLALLLRLYPARFRRFMGPELLAAYTARRAAWHGGRLRCVPRIVAAWLDALWQLPAAWVDEWQRPAAGRRSGENMMQGLLYETRLAARILFTRHRGFTALCVLTLALGLGATTAIFSVVHGVLLAPLPYGEPERIVRVFQGYRGGDWGVWNGPVFSQVREQAASFEAFAGFYDYQPEGIDLTEGQRPERLRLLRVGSGYFEALGVAPMIGRTFRPEEEVPAGAASRSPDRFTVTTGAAQPVVVLSHGFWQRHFGGRESALGERLLLDEQAHTVVGIMPPDFGGYVGGAADVWLPLDLAPGGLNVSGNYYLSAVGRLAPGVTVEQAQAELDRLATVLGQQPRVPDKIAFVLEALDDQVVGASRPMLGLLLAAVAAMLGIACINVANLFLARGLDRHRELAVRSALGAGRRRLFQQTLIESLCIALAGGALGLGLAHLSLRALLALRPEALPRYDALGLHLPVLLFCAGMVVLTVFIFGLRPAFRAAGAQAQQAFGQRGAVGTGGRRGRRLRDAGVSLQIALALVLLMAGSVLARSFFSLHETEMGFDPEPVLAFQLRLPDYGYAEPASRVAFYSDLFARLEGSPGIERSGAMSKLPGNGRRNYWGFMVEGRETPPNQQGPGAEIRCLAGQALETLSVPLVQGRGLGSGDVPESEPVVLVNEELVERYLEGDEALGAQLRVGGSVRTIVGVVADSRHDPREAPLPKIYLPQPQIAEGRNWDLSFVVARAAGSKASWSALRAQVESVVAELDPRLAVFGVQPMSALVAEPIARHRFAAQLMLVFAGMSLLLAAIGLFGAVAYSLDQRRSEIGVRMALGADRRRVLRSVVVHCLGLCLVGATLGLVSFWAMRTWLESLLHEVAPHDPQALAFTVSVLLVAAVLAALEPARRASRLDPAVILRES